MKKLALQSTYFGFGSRIAGDPEQPMGRFESGRIMVMIDRGDYWQCAS